MDSFTWILSLLCVVIALIWLYIRQSFSYWERQNVPGIKPVLPFGNLKGIGKTIHMGELLGKFYAQLKGKGPIGGIYFFTRPVVLALDLEFIKNVLIKDFSYFHERGIYYNDKEDPLSAHLFAIEGEKWRILRSKLSPTFTSGKMKFMFPTVVEVAEKMKLCLLDLLPSDKETVEVEFRDILARYTTDVVGSCVFGLECNSLKEPNNEFRRMGSRVFDVPRYNLIIVFLMAAFRNVARFFRMKIIQDNVSEFYTRIVTETITYREKNDVQRNDFMTLLIQLKNYGKLDDDDVGKITTNELIAQAFVFFVAGFETSSTTLSYCLYELSLNDEVQTKAREEIKNVLAKHNNQFTYEAMIEMRYLDQIINEALRKYPPAPNLIRMVAKDYAMPNSKITLKKGSLLFVPIYGIHHDSEYYPQPEKFDPDRFLPEIAQQRPSMTYLPFGDGPRNCIGSRFGLMETKIGLIMVLQHFKLTKCSKSVIPLEFAKGNIIMVPEKGLWLNMQKI